MPPASTEGPETRNQILAFLIEIAELTAHYFSGRVAEAAVSREVHEETSVVVGDVSYLASQPWPFPASLMIGCKGIAVSEQIRVNPDELEHAEWITREEMLETYANEDESGSPVEGR